MKTFKSLLLVALVFLAGAVAGVVGTRIVVRHVVDEAISHPETIRPRLERTLAFRLGLDRDQRAQLHAIVSDTHEQLEGLRKEYRPQVVLVLSNANSRVAAMLTPEQQVRFEKWKQKNRPLIEALKRNQ